MSLLTLLQKCVDVLHYYCDQWRGVSYIHQILNVYVDYSVDESISTKVCAVPLQSYATN